MFFGAKTFNQPLKWDVSNVIYMEYMFNSAIKFNQELNWDVSKVTSMKEMFINTQLEKNNKLPDWYSK